MTDKPRTRWNSTFRVKPPGERKPRKAIQRSGNTKRSRKRMNQRSKTNSRPHEDLTLRARYRQANIFCEYAPLLPHWFLEDLLKVNYVQLPILGQQIDHIFGGKHRTDVVANLMQVYTPIHEWKTRNSVDGTLVALVCKWRKGEWNDDELNLAKGDNVRAWVERSEPRTEFGKRYQEELMREFDKNPEGE